MTGIRFDGSELGRNGCIKSHFDMCPFILPNQICAVMHLSGKVGLKQLRRLHFTKKKGSIITNENRRPFGIVELVTE